MVSINILIVVCLNLCVLWSCHVFDGWWLLLPWISCFFMYKYNCWNCLN